MEDNHQIALRLENITKIFPGVVALKDVTVEFKKGTVHALVGENGAGKSTLAKIISGALRPDSGRVLLEGSEVNFFGELDAIQRGIAMVYQELNYIPDMTIEENLFLGREQKTSLGLLDRKKRRQDAKKILNELGLDFDVDTLLRDMSVANIQMIEIAKALSRNASVIIFDEPTSSISDKEIKVLFKFIDELKSKGMAIIYISHKFEELDQIADQVTIMRDGELITSKAKTEISREEMINMMVGRPISLYYPKTENKIGDTVLETQHLTRKGMFEDVSFSVHSGEILGISGLVGAGRSEVVSAMFGLIPYESGEIVIDGKKAVIKGPWDAKKYGLALVPEDRKRTGLVLCRPLGENISLPHLPSYRSWFMRLKDETQDIDTQMKHFNVKANNQRVIANTLSGGNQQKVVLAKWLMKSPRVLILDEPTRGIDVGAKQEIYKYMNDMAAAGMAIIMVSSELPEILGMSDRIAVMCEGRITATLDRKDADAETIMKYSIEGM